MREIRVHFDNGDHIETRINGDIDTIVNYYLDHSFPFLSESGKEVTAKARCVEFLNCKPVENHYGKVRRLLRVYTVSESRMKFLGLESKIRCTFSSPNPSLFISQWDKHDCAYVPGMFGYQ